MSQALVQNQALLQSKALKVCSNVGQQFTDKHKEHPLRRRQWRLGALLSVGPKRLCNAGRLMHAISTTSRADLLPVDGVHGVGLGIALQMSQEAPTTERPALSDLPPLPAALPTEGHLSVRAMSRASGKVAEPLPSMHTPAQGSLQLGGLETGHGMLPPVLRAVGKGKPNDTSAMPYNDEAEV